jgi:catechol 2,3-dioxygenase-like lactoylglutathione lyase family enzyme
MCAAVLIPGLLSQEVATKRPAILGLAHVTLMTNDLAAARAFYGHDLGFEEPFGAAADHAIFKVNDHQYIIVYPTLKDDSEDRLMHICFETNDARALRTYLMEHGLRVTSNVSKDADGDYVFTATDPEGHSIEFLEYLKGSQIVRNFGKALPSTRISDRIIHAGFTVQDQAATNLFYANVLGFHDTWHGGMTDTRTDWVDMRVPDGADWLEYMLNQPHPTPRVRGIMNHLALGVPNAQAAYKTLQGRGVKMSEQPKIGRDGKWQLNLYDPNLTRAELMEPTPVQTPCCSPMLDH